MIGIDLICLGGEDKRFSRTFADEYIKRIGAFCSFHERTIKEERLPPSASEREIKAALDREGVNILRALPDRAYKIALCVEGEEISSREFSKLLDKLPLTGFSRCCFLIGSSMGLSEQVKSICEFRLSLSKMTFPHKLARVVLLEQIYRAFSISSGGKYHK